MQRLLVPLLFGFLGVTILVALGVWQLQRLEWKRGVLAQIEERMADPLRALPESPDSQSDKYRAVALSGRIEPQELHVLVSRKGDGAGYRVISAFVTNEGRRILLDRGFIRAEAKTAMRPAGEIRGVGHLNWPDDRNSSTPENDVAKNIWFARDIDEMAQALGTEPLLVILARAEPPQAGIDPMPLDTSAIPNDHLQYAITWFSLAVVWVMMTVFFVVRHRGQGPEETT